MFEVWQVEQKKTFPLGTLKNQVSLAGEAIGNSTLRKKKRIERKLLNERT